MRTVFIQPARLLFNHVAAALPDQFPDGSLRCWSLTDLSLAKAFHCKLLNRGGIDATFAWSGDEKVAFHSTTNTISIYDGSLREKLATIKCDSLKAFRRRRE